MAKIQYNFCSADSSQEKKHPCPDCNFCQFCPNDRCEVCLREQKNAAAKVKCKSKSGCKCKKQST